MSKRPLIGVGSTADYNDMKEKIWLSPPHLSGKEIEYIQEALDSNWVAPVGPNLSGFEKDLEGFLGNGAHATALSSGTAAIHLGLLLLDVQPGDEVLCQTFTYAASANPIFYVGATPVFIDSERDTWNMSPEHLERAIRDRISKGRRPKAIIPVHQHGMPARMDEIMNISQHYGIPVLEDGAESLGSTYKGIHCATIGDLGVLSFNGNKIITTSGGGAIVSRNENIVNEATHLATQARDAGTHYQHSKIGYNYRMSNIIAGIGRGQMLVLPERIARRREINAYYRKALSPFEGITFHSEPSSDFYSNYWLTAMLIDPATTGGITCEDIRLALEQENIEARPVWKPMHTQPVFADYPFYGDGTSEALFSMGLTLPSGSSLSEEDLDRITSIIIKRLS